MSRRYSLLKEINKEIDKRYHRYFNNPSLPDCVMAVLIDTLNHVIVEKMYGLPDDEIKRRVNIYFPRGIKKCLKASFRAAEC